MRHSFRYDNGHKILDYIMIYKYGLFHGKLKEEAK